MSQLCTPILGWDNDPGLTLVLICPSGCTSSGVCLLSSQLGLTGREGIAASPDGNSTKSSRGGNPALPGLPSWAEPQPQVLHQGKDVPVPQGSSHPAVPALPAVWHLCRERNPGEPVDILSLTHSRTKTLLPTKMLLLGTKPRSCLSIHPSGKVSCAESQENGAAQGARAQEGSSRSCRGSLAGGRGDDGGESSQPLGVKLRAAQLSSPGQKQHTEVWAGWQKEPEAASRAQAGAGAVNELTHIPGVSTGAFLTIPLTDTPQFWMWELQGAKAGVPQP